MAAEHRETKFDDVISLMDGHDVRNDSQVGENISEEHFLRYLGKVDVQTGKPLLVYYDKANPSWLNAAIISAGDPLNIPYDRSQLKKIFDYACEKKFPRVLQVLYVFQQQINDSPAIDDQLKLLDWTWIDFQPAICCAESEEVMLEYTGKGTAKKNRTPQFQLTSGEFDRLVTLASLAASNDGLKEKITDAITDKTKEKVYELLKLACRHGYMQLRNTILTAKKLLDDIEGDTKFKLANITTLVNELKLIEEFLEGDKQSLHHDEASANKMGCWLIKRTYPDEKASITPETWRNYLERCNQVPGGALKKRKLNSGSSRNMGHTQTTTQITTTTRVTQALTTTITAATGAKRSRTEAKLDSQESHVSQTPSPADMPSTQIVSPPPDSQATIPVGSDTPKTASMEVETNNGIAQQNSGSTEDTLILDDSQRILDVEHTQAMQVVPSLSASPELEDTGSNSRHGGHAQPY